MTFRSGSLSLLTRRSVRYFIYVAVIAVLFLVRGRDRDGDAVRSLPSIEGESDTLVVAGRDVAPALVDHLVEAYRIDYPDPPVVTRGGGTAHALEDLANRDAGAAFLLRPPTAGEQALLQAAIGDTALWFPIAVGGFLLVVAESSRVEAIDLDGLRASVAGAPGAPFARVVAPDPNTGLWDAFARALGLPDPAPGPGAPAGFLADEAAVLAAVRADATLLGVVGSLRHPEPRVASGVRALRVSPAAGSMPVPPTYEALGEARYPLFHYLYVAVRARGAMSGSKFATHLTSDQGQRQIERAGWLPARLVAREVVISRRPVGAAS